MNKEELIDALIDMLEQYGYNYSISCVENACRVLNHPRTQFQLDEDRKSKNDCCYCRQVVYDKAEAKRRNKLKLGFTDRTK